MRDSDQQKFCEMLLGTGEVYGRKVSTQLTDIYWGALINYDIDDVLRAFNQHLLNPDNGQFFPKPADIVKAIDGNTETQALQAWTKVIKAISSGGSWSSLVFDDELIHAVIQDMGGWIQLCQITIKETPFKKSEFEKRYRAYTINPPANHLKKLTGSASMGNSLNGFVGDEYDQLAIVGDKDKARLVYKSGGDHSVLIEHQKLKLVSTTEIVDRAKALANV